MKGTQARLEKVRADASELGGAERDGALRIGARVVRKTPLLSLAELADQVERALTATRN
jgi:hypothetical protein